jgi:hypothetical protein
VKAPHTARRRAIARELTALIPRVPYADAQAIRELALSARFRELPPSIAVWLATVAHIRHEHTEYDALLKESYDREAARHFTLDAINACLLRWGASRYLGAEDPTD